MYACRSLLSGAASYLWRDPRRWYPKLPGSGSEGLAVTEDKYLNRLGAYLHEATGGGTASEYLRAD